MHLLLAIAVTVVLLQFLVVLGCGLVGIAITSSIRSVLGSLCIGLIFSMGMSCLASLILVLLPTPTGGAVDLVFIFAKVILSAIAQPTISGIVLFAILALLLQSTAKLVAMVEDVNVLIEAHKAYMEEAPAAAAAAEGKPKRG